MTGTRGAVLVVDDEPKLRELYSTYLEDEYDVTTAATGRAAMDAVTNDPDVVLLDRQLPDTTGGDVAKWIDDRDFDCFVVVVSSLEPDFDIVEMPVDQYITKPVSRDRLLATVQTMRSRAACERELQEFFSLAARKATLEQYKNATDLANSTAYRDLVELLEARRSTVAALLDELDERDRDRLVVRSDGGQSAVGGRLY